MEKETIETSCFKYDQVYDFQLHGGMHIYDYIDIPKTDEHVEIISRDKSDDGSDGSCIVSSERWRYDVKCRYLGNPEDKFCMLMANHKRKFKYVKFFSTEEMSDEYFEYMLEEKMKRASDNMLSFEEEREYYDDKSYRESKEKEKKSNLKRCTPTVYITADWRDAFELDPDECGYGDIESYMSCGGYDD